MEKIIPISRLYETISFTINMQYLCNLAEYKAGNREDTYLGRFFQAAISQKKMVSSRIMESGNRLAGMV